MEYVGFTDPTKCPCPKKIRRGRMIKLDTQPGCPEHDPFTDGDLDSPPDEES